MKYLIIIILILIPVLAFGEVYEDVNGCIDSSETPTPDACPRTFTPGPDGESIETVAGQKLKIPPGVVSLVQELDPTNCARYQAVPPPPVERPDPILVCDALWQGSRNENNRSECVCEKQCRLNGRVSTPLKKTEPKGVSGCTRTCNGNGGTCPNGTILENGRCVRPSRPDETSGSSGSSGSFGTTGTAGFTGSSGFTGTTGFSGSTGTSGNAGFSGSSGFTGGAGFTGTTGGVNSCPTLISSPGSLPCIYSCPNAMNQIGVNPASGICPPCPGGC